MLTYAKLALAIYNVAKWIVTRLERQKWISKGRAEVIQEQLESAREEAQKSIAAEQPDAVDSRPMHEDPNNLDRKPDR